MCAWLQRGRAHRSAESSSGGTKQFVSSSFNEAALTGARRADAMCLARLKADGASTRPRSQERGEGAGHGGRERQQFASTRPRSQERGECSSVTSSGAGSQYFARDSRRCFECLSACDVQLSWHYQLVLRRLRSASAGGVLGITSPLAD